MISRIVELLFGEGHRPVNETAARQAALYEVEQLTNAETGVDYPADQVRYILTRRDQGTTWTQLAIELGFEDPGGRGKYRVRQLEARGLRLLRQPRRGLRRL